MSFFTTRISMRHLHILSLVIIVVAVLWIVYGLFLAPDPIWVIPGLFLLLTGVIKVVGLRIWERMDAAEKR